MESLFQIHCQDQTSKILKSKKIMPEGNTNCVSIHKNLFEPKVKKLCKRKKE